MDCSLQVKEEGIWVEHTRREGGPVPTAVGWLVTLPYLCANSELHRAK